MNDNEIVAALNELVEASKDAEKVLTNAADDARDPELASVVSDAEAANRIASAELQDQVRLLGRTTEQTGSFSAAARRGWASIKSMVSSRDDSAIIEESAQGQGSIRARYAEALELDMPQPIRSVVERHHRAIVDTHYRLLDLRNRFRDARGRAIRAGD